MSDRCGLCGSRLNHGKCEFCGYDNRMYDPEKYIKRDGTPPQKKLNSGSAKSRKIPVIIALVIVICVAAPVLFQIIRLVTGAVSALDTNSSGFDSSDLYIHADREIPDSGSPYEVTLGDGFYQVGIHIPEGVYHVELTGGRGELHISDMENSIYGSIWFGDGAEYSEVMEADDIRLYNGAEVSVYGGCSLLFTTENAQPFTQDTAANPLTETYVIEDGSNTAGESIPEGMYDIILRGSDKYMTFGLDLSYPNGYSEFLWSNIDSGGSDVRIRNVIIPYGTEFILDGDTVEFIPSEGYFEADFGEYPWN